MYGVIRKSFFEGRIVLVVVIFCFDLYILFYFSNLFIYLILNEIKEKVTSVEIQIKK